MGVEITDVNVSPANNSTTVTRITGIVLYGCGHPSIKRAFLIAPTYNSGLNATLKFKFFDHELNTITASNLEMFKTASPYTTWLPQLGVLELATPPTFITKTGISSFSLWTQFCNFV